MFPASSRAVTGCLLLITLVMWQGFNPLEVPTSYGDTLTVWDYEKVGSLL